MKKEIRPKEGLLSKSAYAAAILLLCAVLNTQAQYTYTTISVPGAADTWVYGVLGNSIVGSDFVITSSSGGTMTGHYQDFIYDGSTYTILNVPGGSGYPGAGASGISGNNIVGTYDGGNYYGFVYNGGAYTTLNVTGETFNNTWAYGISGNDIVGSYGSANHQGFIYDGSSYTTLNFPGAVNTDLHGISGNNIVGDYTLNGNGTEIGFLYNGSTFTTLSVPGAASTQAYGISGNNIVGTYAAFPIVLKSQGFLYDGSSYTTLNVPGAVSTWAYGISGNEIVGYYQSSGGYQGFVAVPVPEASTWLLLAVGTFFSSLAKRKMQLKRDYVV
jgi:hypothetical protein